MIVLIFLISILQNPMTDRIDFGHKESNSPTWYVVNDGVMGGVSSGNVSKTDSSVVWTGYISFENNGGFSAFRSEISKFDLSKFTQVRIHYRSSGQDLDFALYPHRPYFMPNYKVHLGNTKGAWTEKTFALEDFEKYVLGKKKNSKNFQRET